MDESGHPSVKQSTKPCHICAERTFTSVYKTEVLEYFVCMNCGFVFLDEQKNQNELGDFYNDGYQKERHGVVEYEKAVARLGRKGSYENKKPRARELTEYLKESTKVLEIGTGYGTFLKVLTDMYGVVPRGIEPGHIGARVASEHYGLPVTHGTLESVFEIGTFTPDDTFDFIMMIHVLEHLSNPRGQLLKVVSILAPEGLLYIAVPNIMKPDEPLDRFFHDEHLSYFSLRTLRDLLADVGLKIISYKEKKLEIALVVANQSSKREAADTSTFDHMCAPKRVIETIERQDQKYRLLRGCKRMLGVVVPTSFIKKITPKISAALRKIGVIKV